MTRKIILPTVFLLLVILQPRPVRAQSTEIWAHPNINSVLGFTDWSTIFADQSLWQNFLPNIDVFGFFFYPVYNNEGQFLQRAIPLFNTYGVKIAIEGYGSHPWLPCDSRRGENAAGYELTAYKKIYDNGGTLSYIVLDDTIARNMINSQYNLSGSGNCGYQLGPAVTEVVDFIKTVHATYPAIKFGLITNFPNWEYDATPTYWGPTRNFGNYRDALEEFFRQLEAAGEHIEFVRVDNPYDYALGIVPTGFTGVGTIDWVKRILDLETQVKSHGVGFSLIYNSDRGGTTSDQKFYEDVLAFINLYKSRSGTSRDIAIESWYPYPKVLVPETTTYSFANSVLTAGYPSVPIGSLDATSCTAIMGWSCDADNFSATIQIHVYKDGPFGQGTFVSSTEANLARESAVGSACGGNVNHGFSLSTPASLKDNLPHSIWAYAINTPVGPNVLLAYSPKNLTRAPPAVPGDLNGDGKVDSADMTIMLADFGKTGTPGFIPADLNSDGTVNIFDVSIIIANFGK